MKITIPPIQLESSETRVLSEVDHEIHQGDSVDKEGLA
jgi:hypothetical protein